MADTGITGTTSSFVVGGVVPEGRPGGPRSLKFAIAPFEDGDPSFDKASFVTSDAAGKYEVVLRPGEYWLGPAGKALDPANYSFSTVEFLPKMAVVKKGVFTVIDISEIGFAP